MNDNPHALEWSNFRKNTDAHTLSVLHEDGVYRHLKMAEGDSNIWSWEIVTFPGSLVFRGDRGDLEMIITENVDDISADLDFEDVPPRQLSFAPGGVVKARAERGSWDIWFLPTCNGVRTWQYTDGEWAGSDELNEGELIHDEGATQ